MRLRSVGRLGVALAVIGCAALLPAAARATFPGENGKIVFVKDWDLWTINPDGSGLAQLTSGQTFDELPSWAPDGSALAFGRYPPVYDPEVPYEGADIFIMDSQGSLREFGTYPADDFAPAWSPDGQKLVYTTERNAHIDGIVEQPRNLMTANLDGTDRRVLLANSFPYIADWSPLGTRIVYVFTYDLANLFAIDPDGSNGTEVTSYETIGDSDSSPSWSPDGTHLAFSRHRENENVCVPGPEPNSQVCTGGSAIYVANADGSEPQNLGNPGPASHDGYPVWSPDGSQIAFTRYEDGGPSGIYIMDADGGNAHFLTEGSQPDWQPLIAPRHLHPPRVAADPRESRAVAGMRGLWLGTPTVGYAYQWSLCDAAGENCADIADAVGSSYTPTHEDVGHRLTFTVTATNDYGSPSPATSEPSAIVGASLVGSPAADLLTGTEGSDLLSGGGGGDTIRLGAGNDSGQGGYGNDWIAGGAGKDVLRGGPGRDRLRGGSGNDRVYARDGYRDVVSCGPGRDFVRADRRDRVARSCEIVRYG